MASFSDLAAFDKPSDSLSGPSVSTSRPTLLPAFEPLSSSPGLPRPAKRKADGSPTRSGRHYPTPVPTSSTNILPSSPSRLPANTRPGLQRTVSSVSERVPLGDVPSLELPISGEPVLLGRSGNSSQYQLPASRLISRVHVRAWYEAPSEARENGRIMIECVGWNGMKVLCRGGPVDLGKLDTFSSDKPQQDIFADIQDTRVMIRWPALARKGSAVEDFWGTDDSPPSAARRREAVPSSPPIHLQSPVSPSPRARLTPTASSTFLGMPFGNASSPPAVQVYEDHESADEVEGPAPGATEPVAEDAMLDTKPVLNASQSSSALSSPDEFSDHEEENDPIVHSFYQSGDNLLPRMASFRAVSPERRREPLRDSVSPRQSQLGSSFSPRASIRAGKRRALGEPELSPIRNHVINQLAYSRLHSLPLSTIMNNLPATLRAMRVPSEAPEDGRTAEAAPSLSDGRLKQLLDDTACVGEIVREGKDAAGKPLENEFYYVPEMDTDGARKDAVENSRGKPGLRSVRKQHKQYFWKKPRF